MPVAATQSDMPSPRDLCISAPNCAIKHNSTSLSMTKYCYKSSPIKVVMQFVIHFDLSELGDCFFNNFCGWQQQIQAATLCFCALRSPSSFCQHYVCKINCDSTQGFLIFHPPPVIYTFILPSVASLPQPGGVLLFLIYSQSFHLSYSVRCFRCAFSNCCESLQNN